MNKDYELQTCLEDIWEQAARIYNLNPAYERYALKIQTLVVMMSNEPELINREEVKLSQLIQKIVFSLNDEGILEKSIQPELLKEILEYLSMRSYELYRNLEELGDGIN